MDIISELIIYEKAWHEKWGLGDVIDINDRRVSVKFGSEVKKFIFPDAFEKFLAIVDIDLYEKKYYEYKSRDIRTEIERRNIKYFVHFTNIKNLKSILENGLLPVATLQSDNISFISNDTNRLDNKLDAISLSITFPNCAMFYKYRQKNPEEKWVVILYDAKEVAKLDCSYYEHNAASHE